MSNTVENPTAYAALNLLGQTPRTDIDPKIWTELQRVRRALGEMAGLMDLVNKPPYTTIEDKDYSIFLQDQTTIEVTAAEDIDGYTVVNIFNSGGIAKARNAVRYESSGWVGYPMCAYWPYAGRLGAGQKGPFILKGLAGYGRTIYGNTAVRGDLWMDAQHGLATQLYAYNYKRLTDTPRASSHGFFAGYHLDVLSNGAHLIYFNPNRAKERSKL